MGRWEPDARQRLQQSAMTLFGERGYDNVTVADIAARAGLTRRTFFNHFSDKREIFFVGAADFEAGVRRCLDDADPSLSPLGAAVTALGRAGNALAEFRDHAPAVRAIIDAAPELRERELAKSARLADVLVPGLQRRGAARREAAVTARLALLAFDIAWQDWVDSPDRDFGDVMWEAVGELHRASRAV